MTAVRHRFSGRTAALIAVPVLVGALGALGTAAVPASLVHGNVHTGPQALADIRRVILNYRPAVTWGPRRKTVILVAHPRGACRIDVRGTSSTAPGRIEVIAVETSRDCIGRRTVERISLPLPLLLDPHGGVRVQVGAESLHLPGISHVEPHPEGVLDAD